MNLNLRTKHDLIEQLRGSIESCDELSEEIMWSRSGTLVWESGRFIGSPQFYPVYRYENLYSYSPLSLILHKGNLCLNAKVVQRASEPNFRYYSGMDTIDLEITRIGGPLNPTFATRESDRFAQQIAEAMCKDANAIETINPKSTNVILCGGKDSLNLLLLPWKNPVIAASAYPNFEFVKKFVKDNELKFDVIRLEDDNNSLLELEILVNCCRNNLEHCRWGYHLKKLSQSLDEKVVFWKGQMADAFMTPYWKTYRHKSHSTTVYGRLVNYFSSRLENKLDYFLDENKLIQRRFFKSMWQRGAMWQGAHMSIMRQLTNSLVLSGYHGPSMRSVLSQVHLHGAVQDDIRPIVGKYLKGGEVLYPASNPGPSPSSMRKGISHSEPFLKILSSLGISIREK